MTTKPAQPPAGTTAPRLTITVNGPKVGPARLSAADLAEIVNRTQQAVKRVARVLYGDESERPGRDKADIEQLCEIFLVAWQPGSAVAQLELGEPPAQMHMFGYIGEQSVKAFVHGMPEMAKAETSASRLPRGFDRGVLQTCQALGQVLEHGIDAVSFAVVNGDAMESFTLDSALRSRVRELLERPTDVSATVKIGRLEELNGHGVLTGRLWEPDGKKWLCHFKAPQLEQLPEAWMRTVRVAGRAILEEGKEPILEVESVEPVESLSNAQAPQKYDQFWRSISLDELATQQGVSAASDLDEISALWPADDDPDEMIEYILHERGARRALTEGGRGE